MAWSLKSGYQKITVPMYRRHVAALDRFAVEARLRHGIILSRSQIIRALIDLHEAKGTVKAKRHK
jgi:hypothetical protein